MGSLENGLPVKRDPLLRSSSIKGSVFQRPILRFSRFFFFGKLDYLLWVCTVAVFCFFVVLFQMFLPGLKLEHSGNSLVHIENGFEDLSFIKDIGGLDFGEGIRFEPSRLLQKFQKEPDEINLISSPRLRHRFGYRKPQLALVSVPVFSLQYAELDHWLLPSCSVVLRVLFQFIICLILIFIFFEGFPRSAA